MLNKVSEALASIHQLTVTECEQAFSCDLREGDAPSGRYWGTCPELNIEVLDVRIGERGGIVVASFEAGVQISLANEMAQFSEPVEMDIVSPPVQAESALSWQRKWRVGYLLFGAKIHFGMEVIDGQEFLIYASRTFDT